MRHPHTITVTLPEGTSATLEKNILNMSKEGTTLTRKMQIPNVAVTLQGTTLTLECKKANKKDIATMKAYISHVNNMIKGLETAFEYKLEICHVHFPMTCKVEGTKVTITNFLGEKTARYAKILDGVTVEIKGQEVTVTGHDLEKTGQTAANMEKATKVPNKDRRVFQDGIFITHKPGGAI